MLNSTCWLGYEYRIVLRYLKHAFILDMSDKFHLLRLLNEIHNSIVEKHLELANELEITQTPLPRCNNNYYIYRRDGFP